MKTPCGLCGVLSSVCLLVALIIGYAVLERGCDPFKCTSDDPDAELINEGHFECTDSDGAIQKHRLMFVYVPSAISCGP